MMGCLPSHLCLKPNAGTQPTTTEGRPNTLSIPVLEALSRSLPHCRIRRVARHLPAPLTGQIHVKTMATGTVYDGGGGGRESGKSRVYQW